MPLLRITLVDSQQSPLSAQAVRVNGSSESLQTNADGTVQFLLEDQPSYDIQINGRTVWMGGPGGLQRHMSFVQQASGAFSAG